MNNLLTIWTAVSWLVIVVGVFIIIIVILSGILDWVSGKFSKTNSRESFSDDDDYGSGPGMPPPGVY